MNRNSWKFAYTADKLLLAAETKLAFHEGRMAWWKDKRKEVEEKIKSEGIEIDDSVAANLNITSNSAYRGPVAQIRNDLIVDLGECVQKVNEHQTKIRDYDAWRQVLASQGQASLELQQDDWLFFFGK